MPYKPVGKLRGRRYVTVAEASAMLDGLLSPGTIRDMVRAGRVAGAILAGRRYFVPRAHVGELIVDMSGGDPKTHDATLPTTDEIGWKSRRAHTLLDGYMDAG